MVFHSVNESVFERIERASDSMVYLDGLTCFVSIESAILNESFDLNDSESHLLKQRLAGDFIVIFNYDRPKAAKMPAQKYIQQNIVYLSVFTKIPLFQAPEEKNTYK